MSPPEPQPELAALQSWLFARLTGAPCPPADPPTRLHRPPIASRRGVSAEARMQIYARGYFLRLRDCLRADFPTLRSLLGDGLFDHFAREYLAAHPSQSASLFELGAGFAAHLLATRPPLDEVPAHVRPMLALPSDVAALERACLEASRAEGVRGEPKLARLHPLGALGLPLLLRRPPCLRLVRVRFELTACLRAVHSGETPPRPEPRPAHTVAVGRAGFRVTMTELSEWQAQLLAALDPDDYRGLDALLTGVDSNRASVGLWLPAAEQLGLVEVRIANAQA